LAILPKFTPAEIKKSLRLFVSWAVRFLIVGGLGGGTLESYYSQRAKEVTDGTIKNASQLLKAMRGVIPTDARFEREFATATVSKPVLARYYLMALEKQVRGEAEPEFVPNPNEEQINLEHVLPQTPSNAWGHINADSAKAAYKRLGNMALLKTRINVAVANKGFAEKKKFYRPSEFKLTKEIAKYPTWTTSEIDARQQALAKVALDAWPNKI
jgi:hypothetical protein